MSSFSLSPPQGRKIPPQHKDMALAMLGAIIAMLLTAAINVYLQRAFARQLAESLRVKRHVEDGFAV